MNSTADEINAEALYFNQFRERANIFYLRFLNGKKLNKSINILKILKEYMLNIYVKQLACLAYYMFFINHLIITFYLNFLQCFDRCFGERPIYCGQKRTIQNSGNNSKVFQGNLNIIKKIHHL